MRCGGPAALLVLAALLCGCSPGAGPVGAPEPSVSTLSPLPLPDPPPPSGTLTADVRQASRDVALGRFQVWVRNGTRRPVRPTEVRYADPRFAGPLVGGRLREIPPGRERGFTFAQPARPRCGRDGTGTLLVRAGDRSWRVAVEDEADVVARYVDSRCLELAVARVARISFADRVPVRGGVGRLLLRVEPTGRPGRLVLEEVTGTPVLTPASAARWPLGLVVGERPRTVPLPVRPARCDGHAFAESGGATTFRVAVRVAGERGTLLVPMSPAGAAAAIAFAQEQCGLS